MYGRFVRITPVSVLAMKFKAEHVASQLASSYNIAPNQEIVIINEEGVRQLVQCKWGFIPSWAKDPAAGYTLINARSETIARKPAFRSAFKKKRCMVIADGFYEWRTEKKKKFPMYIRLKSGDCFGVQDCIMYRNPLVASNSLPAPPASGRTVLLFHRGSNEECGKER